MNLVPRRIEAGRSCARLTETDGAAATTPRHGSGWFAIGSAVGCRWEVGDVAQGGLGDAVEDGFEVVEEDGVGGAFEDEGKLQSLVSFKSSLAG